MDIQDTKEQHQAFEAWFESRYDANFMQFVILDGVYQDKHTQTCWEAWQAAQSKAVPDGFVVVPKAIPENVVERLKNSNYHWGENTKNYFTPIYEMMVEEAAQEQAND